MRADKQIEPSRHIKNDNLALSPVGDLDGFKGVLHADGYSGFKGLYDKGDVQEAACWAHARRKLFDIAARKNAPIAEEALKRIAKLYEIEKRLRGEPPDQRRQARQHDAKPKIDDLKAWMETSLRKLPEKTETARAVRYALKRWEALTRHLDDGTVEIDDDIAERAIRPIALGRKNWLFAGSDSAGERAAAILSLTETAKLNGLDPEAGFANHLDFSVILC